MRHPCACFDEIAARIGGCSCSIMTANASQASLMSWSNVFVNGVATPCLANYFAGELVVRYA
jgi:hypothetical protein